MLGKALDFLKNMGDDVAKNTITIFHSDHGYQLGELNEWSKKTNTELGVHVPLLIRVPWMTNTPSALVNRGVMAGSLWEEKCTSG